MLTETVAGRTYDYSHSVGRGAQTGMGFSNPVAAALGQDDILYVVNRGSESISNVAWNRPGVGGRICKVTLGSEAGKEEFIGEFSKYGDSDGQLIWGVGIAADNQGNVYATDGWLNRVTVFDKEGDYLRHWSAIEAGAGEDEVNGIAGIAMDSSENLYITDGRSHKVRKFTKDGKFLSSWGSLGDGPDQLDSPWGITVDGDDFVYVADFKNHRVQKFTSDGKFVAQFGSQGTHKGQLSYPVGVAVDNDGDVYICDWSKNQPIWRCPAACPVGTDHGRRQRRLHETPPRGQDHRTRVELRPARRRVLRHHQQPPSGDGHPTQPHTDIQQERRLLGSPAESVNRYTGFGRPKAT